MKYVLETNPEVATFAFFEPVVVGEEFTCANQNNEHDNTLQELQRNGKIILIHTEGGAGGTLHVYVDDSPPQALSNFVLQSHVAESFRVRANELHFAGIAGYIHPDEFHLPPTGASFPIAAGTYRVRIDEIEFDRECWMTMLADHTSPKEYFLVKWFDTLMVVSGIVVLCCLLSKFFMSWLAWLIVMILVAVPAFLIPQFWARSQGYQRAMQIGAKLQTQQLPDLVATFERFRGNE